MIADAHPPIVVQPRLVVDDRAFFAGMALAALAVVFLGFATSYYFWPLFRATTYPAGQPISPSIPLIVHIHALLFSAWILLLVAQVTLVTTGRVAVHRRVGTAASWLVPVMVITALATAVRGARDGWNPGGPFPDALGFMIVGIGDITIFAGLTAAALAWRRRPAVHKRLMILGTIGGLMWPAITRMPVIAGRIAPMFGLLILLALAPAVRDFRRRTPERWLSLAVGVGILLSFPLRTAAGTSEWWRTFAAWVIR
jgi:hypothetical protein